MITGPLTAGSHQLALLERHFDKRRVKLIGLSADSAERKELTRLRRENRKLKEERDILSKAAAWLTGCNGA